MIEMYPQHERLLRQIIKKLYNFTLSQCCAVCVFVLTIISIKWENCHKNNQQTSIKLIFLFTLKGHGQKQLGCLQNVEAARLFLDDLIIFFAP